jgi:hypothetical protein
MSGKRTLARAWSIYSSNVEDEKAIAFKTLRAVTCWANRCLHGCLRGWEARATEESRRKRIATRILVMSGKRTLARAWSMYSSNVEDEKAIAFKTLRAVTCWANRCLHGCLRGWEARATEESSRKRIATRIQVSARILSRCIERSLRGDVEHQLVDRVMYIFMGLKIGLVLSIMM